MMAGRMFSARPRGLVIVSSALLLVSTIFCGSASAYTYNVLASINGEDNGDCSATYTGTHTVQVLGVQQSDTDTVGVSGKLWKKGNLGEQIVSECSTGGQLPHRTL